MRASVGVCVCERKFMRLGAIVGQRQCEEKGQCKNSRMTIARPPTGQRSPNKRRPEDRWSSGHSSAPATS